MYSSYLYTLVIANIKTAPVSAVDHGRDQSREEDDVKRPRTADAKVFFALSQRPLSTLNNRTSSTSDLTALDTGNCMHCI